MRRNFYMVSMVLERENEDIETWTGFGGTYIRNKALATAREVQKEIDGGKWDERKKDGCTLRMCVEEFEPKTFDLLSVTKV